MRAVALLVLATGCDRVLGLHATQLADAPPVEAPPPPPMCPTSGPLMFSQHISQIVSEACADYTIAVDVGRALARCPALLGSSTLADVSEGAVDNALSHVTDFDGLAQPAIARIDPDGLGAIVRGTASAGVVTDRRFRRTSLDAPWLGVHDITELAMFATFTTPTRGPNAHVIAFDLNNATELEEQADGSWSTVATTSLLALGMPTATAPALTADGKRLLSVSVVAGPEGQIRHVYYVDRDALGDAWNSPAIETPTLASFISVSDGVAPSTLGYMTEDCGRFYFSALFSIFYVQQ